MAVLKAPEQKQTVRTLFFCLLCFTFMFAMGQKDVNDAIVSTKTGVIRIKSDAPLELIQASSHELKGVIDIAKRTFSFSVKSRSIQGFNSPLQQEHFYENYIEATRYPLSTFTGKIIEQVNLATDGNYQVRAKGMLTIHGVEQERIIKVNLKVSNGIIKADAVFMVPLSDHNITIPKVVYQKIAEEILVTVNATFDREPK